MRERGVQGEGQEGFCGGNGFMLGPDGGLRLCLELGKMREICKRLENERKIEDKCEENFAVHDT